METVEQMYQRWGAAVRKLREDNGMLQSTLAQRCKVRQQHISRIESGTGRPSDEMRIRIANAFGVDPNELFSLEKKKGGAKVG